MPYAPFFRVKGCSLDDQWFARKYLNEHAELAAHNQSGSASADFRFSNVSLRLREHRFVPIRFPGTIIRARLDDRKSLTIW